MSSIVGLATRVYCTWALRGYNSEVQVSIQRVYIHIFTGRITANT